VASKTLWELIAVGTPSNLIPPLSEINNRLSENLRERDVLRRLQRIALKTEEWAADDSRAHASSENRSDRSVRQ
jgi:hypothetical protein